MMYKVYKKARDAAHAHHLIAAVYHVTLLEAHRICDNAPDRDEYHYLIYACA